MYNKKNSKLHLINILDDLFGNRNISDSEFNFRSQVLGEIESTMVEDGRLTWSEICEIEECWTPNHEYLRIA